MSTLSPDDVAILQHRDSFIRFATHINSATSFVRAGSDADSDRELTQSRTVPVSLVDGFVASITDHLTAWAEKAGYDAREPILRLSLYSDYTLFRPVIESLASLIWVLAPDSQLDRIKHAVTLANVERARGRRFVESLAAAGTPDEEMARSIAALDGDLRGVCARAGLDPARLLDANGLDPSSLTRKVSQFVPGPTLDVFRHWATCSAHAHAQLMTTLTRATRTQGVGVHGDFTYAEANSEHLAELVRFIARLLDIMVGLLNKRGHVLDTANPPDPRHSAA